MKDSGKKGYDSICSAVAGEKLKYLDILSTRLKQRRIKNSFSRYIDIQYSVLACLGNDNAVKSKEKELKAKGDLQYNQHKLAWFYISTGQAEKATKVADRYELNNKFFDGNMMLIYHHAKELVGIVQATNQEYEQTPEEEGRFLDRVHPNKSNLERFVGLMQDGCVARAITRSIDWAKKDKTRFMSAKRQDLQVYN
jgi:hypothetical protein